MMHYPNHVRHFRGYFSAFCPSRLAWDGAPEKPKGAPVPVSAAPAEARGAPDAKTQLEQQRAARLNTAKAERAEIEKRVEELTKTADLMNGLRVPFDAARPEGFRGAIRSHLAPQLAQKFPTESAKFDAYIDARAQLSEKLAVETIVEKAFALVWPAPQSVLLEVTFGADGKPVVNLDTPAVKAALGTARAEATPALAASAKEAPQTFDTFKASTVGTFLSTMFGFTTGEDNDTPEQRQERVEAKLKDAYNGHGFIGFMLSALSLNAGASTFKKLFSMNGTLGKIGDKITDVVKQILTAAGMDGVFAKEVEARVLTDAIIGGAGKGELLADGILLGQEAQIPVGYVATLKHFIAAEEVAVARDPSGAAGGVATAKFEKGKRYKDIKLFGGQKLPRATFVKGMTIERVAA